MEQTCSDNGWKIMGKIGREKNGGKLDKYIIQIEKITKKRKMNFENFKN